MLKIVEKLDECSGIEDPTNSIKYTFQKSLIVKEKDTMILKPYKIVKRQQW